MNENKIPEIVIDKQYMNNTLLFRCLIKEGKTINEQAIKIDKGNTVCQVNSASPDFAVDMIDKTIIDALYTLWANHYQIFTDEIIGRVICGNMKKRVSPLLQNDIRTRINKMQTANVIIEACEYKKDTVENVSFEGRLIDIERIDGIYSTNHKNTKAYKLLSCPILYKFAEWNHQIAVVPSEAICVPGNTSWESIIIQRYVIQRVAQISHKNKLVSNKISYSWKDKHGVHGLFAELGYNPIPNKKIKSKINKQVLNTLLYLKKIKMIEDFSLYRESKTNNPASPIAGWQIDKKSNVKSSYTHRNK